MSAGANVAVPFGAGEEVRGEYGQKEVQRRSAATIDERRLTSAFALCE
jgi:hypothetical protein